MESSIPRRYAVAFNALSDGKDIGGNYFFNFPVKYIPRHPGRI